MTITEHRDAARALLETRWAWCAANPTHPLFPKREAMCLIALADYERLEDAVRAAPVSQTAFIAPASADRYTG